MPGLQQAFPPASACRSACLSTGSLSPSLTTVPLTCACMPPGLSCSSLQTGWTWRLQTMSRTSTFPMVGGLELVAALGVVCMLHRKSLTMVCLVAVAILLLKAASQWQSQHGSKLPQGSAQRSEFKKSIQSWQRSIDGVPIEVSCPA